MESSASTATEAATPAQPAEAASAVPGAAPKRFVLERGCEPALLLLEVLGCDRSSALDALAERAGERLVAAVPSMPPRRLLALLSASFAHIESPRLRGVAVAALTHAPELPPEIVASLTGERRELLATLPLRVRHRVWETEEPPNLFLAETHPLVMQLTQELQRQFARAAFREAAEVPPRQRRAECAPLQRLTALVGSRPLYASFSKLCAEIYAVTTDAAIGALRLDLTMALHEADEPDRPIGQWEPAHTFICCIDAALREQRLEARAVNILLAHATLAGLPALAGALGGGGGALVGPTPPPAYAEAAADGAASGKALAELARLLSPPPVLQLLADSVLLRLENVVDRNVLPGSDGQLRSLVSLYWLSLRSPLLSKATAPPPPEKWQAQVGLLLHRALPVLADLLVCDRIRAVRGGGGGGGVDAAAMLALPEAFKRMLAKGHARHVVLLYVLRCVEAADEPRVAQLLPRVASLGAELRAHPDFVGGLVSALIHEPTRRLTPTIARAAVTGCLVPLSAALTQAHWQLLRLMRSQWQLLQAIPAEAASGEVDGILAAAGVGGGSLISMIPAELTGGAKAQPAALARQEGGAKAALTLLQAAARAANEGGVVDEGDDVAVQRAYDQLQKLVPGVLLA